MHFVWHRKIVRLVVMALLTGLVTPHLKAGSFSKIINTSVIGGLAVLFGWKGYKLCRSIMAKANHKNACSFLKTRKNRYDSALQFYQEQKDSSDETQYAAFLHYIHSQSESVGRYERKLNLDINQLNNYIDQLNSSYANKAAKETREELIAFRAPLKNLRDSITKIADYSMLSHLIDQYSREFAKAYAITELPDEKTKKDQLQDIISVSERKDDYPFSRYVQRLNYVIDELQRSRSTSTFSSSKQFYNSLKQKAHDVVQKLEKILALVLRLPELKEEEKHKQEIERYKKLSDDIKHRLDDIRWEIRNRYGRYHYERYHYERW